ncbi:MAG: 1-acyl-sn-glycerol-3-phosphate acyltransferase [Bacteroidales bacterium]|nr:1-acyl-sn-glycerol-3-phosphate acyltransferase [Bacteroidales bacterium]
MKRLHDLFYREIEVVNAKIIPRKRSVILAPNHQNALMDPLAFVFGIPQQTVFLARADVFANNTLVKILTFMKILPIFRIRDGVANLQKNEEIFDITVRILLNKRNPLLLFPEGNHGDRRRLRPLVKGIFRIAFQAQEKYGHEPGVIIIPTGVDYSHYWKFRQKQLVIFGEPIEVNEYWQAYQENPSIAINQLRERLSEEMRKVMIDIKTEDYYPLYMNLRTIVGPKHCKLLGRNPSDLLEKFKADKILIAKLDACLEKEPDKIGQLNSTFLKYKALRRKLNFRDWVPSRKSYNIAWNVFLLIVSPIVWPLVLLGLFNNWVHLFFPPFIKQKIKDEQFYSTAVWGAGLVALSVYHILLIVLAFIFLDRWWMIAVYILTLGSTGIFAIGYRNFIVKAWARIRYAFWMRTKKQEVLQLKAEYDSLVSQSMDIVEKY